MANQLQITGDTKVKSLNGVLTGTSGVVSSVPLGAANGVATLDSGGKVPVSQLPSSVVTYLGTWNAATNTPTLTNGVGDAGDMYICNVAGTVNFGAGPVTFAVGDWVLYGSGTWQKSNGQNGTVTSVGATITGSAIGITGSPITTAGTLAFAFAGTSGQYVNGAGNLTTFPTLITSIGLSMPSAFSVANSPLTANGSINVTGAGSSTQYIDGTGSLQTFPTIITEAQNLICDVYNETGATLTKGTVVYINGGHGNLPTVTKALATSDATSAQTFGIVQTNITNNNNGHVVVIGNLTDLDTQAYAEGTQLYLSSTTAGAYTSVKQYAPAHLVYVAIVVRSHPTQGIIQVKIQNGFEMDELHNVYAQSPANGGILQYVTSTGLWTAVAGTTTNIAEGTNLYFTNARAIASTLTGYTSGAGTITSSDSILSAIQKLNGNIGALTTGVSSVFGRTGAVVATSGDYTTTQVTEGTNLYYTDARARLALGAGAGISYNSTTGVITSTITQYTDALARAAISGGTGISYNSTTGVITNTITQYTDALARAAISLTTTGTSGAATYNSTTGVLNIPQYIGGVTSVFGRTGAVVATEGDYTLTQLGDVTITSPTTGQVLKYNGTTWINDTDANTGTVTSVGLSAPTGFSVTGSPVTSSGTLALAFASGYSLPTNVKQSNWDDAYTWVAAFPTQTGNNGKYLTTNGSVLSWADNPLGTVTSVAMTVPTGLSVSGSPITSSGTLAVTLTAGYSIPTTASQTNWDTAYTNRITSATAPLSITSNVISISQATTSTNGYLSSTDWNTFNNKQSALTNPVTGTGYTNYLPKFTGTSTIGNSVIQESSSLIGINVTPTRVLHLSSSGANAAIRLDNTTSGRPFLITYDDSQNLTFINSSDSGYTAFNSGTGASTTKMILSNSGNLGLGVTPSAWSTGSTLDVSTKGSLHTSSSIGLLLGRNVYYDGSYKYKATGISTALIMDDGGYNFQIAPSGTAGNAITFTQAMTLFSDGNLGLGTSTNSGYKLDVNGTGRFSGVLTGASGEFINGGQDGSLGSVVRISTTNAVSFSRNWAIVNTWDNYGDLTFRVSNAQGGNALSAGSSKMVILSTGNVGIGTTSPTNKLTIQSNSTQLRLETASDPSNYYSFIESNYNAANPLNIYSSAAASYAFGTISLAGISGVNTYVNSYYGLIFGTGGTSISSGTVRGMVTQGGNWLIGTTTDAGYKLDVNGTGRFSGILSLPFNPPATTGGMINIRDGAANGSNTSFGGVFFNSSPGSDYSIGKLSENSNGFLQIRNANNGNELLRIGGTGAATFSSRLMVNGATDDGSNALQVNGSIVATSTIAAVVPSNVDMFVFNNTGATYTKSCVVASMTATGGTGSYFFYGQQSTSTVALKIFSNGNIQNTNNSYGAISDARLKENIIDATPKLADLMKVKVRNYNLKGESNKQLGVISQELEEIFPNMIEESTNLGENVKIKGVKYSVFVPMLIKAVQEQQEQINELKQLLNK